MPWGNGGGRERGGSGGSPRRDDLEEVLRRSQDKLRQVMPGGSGLSGTLTVTPQNGIATFSNLSVSNAGSYTLSATSSGLVQCRPASLRGAPAPENGEASASTPFSLGARRATVSRPNPVPTLPR